jgi:hypothetical protein
MFGADKAVAAVTVVIYGALLAVGFRIGQKACEYVESGKAKTDFDNLKSVVRSKYEEVKSKPQTEGV